MASEGLTRGGISENAKEHVKLARLHGDLDAMAIIQKVITLPLLGSTYRPGVIVSDPNWGITFEGKKHLWNMLSRLTKRVDDVILKDGMLVREVIHLAAKGRKAC